MVFVTHDQIEAMTMADRIVVLQGGVVQQYDTPEVVYERPANQFVAGFIGSPKMNFIACTLEAAAAGAATVRLAGGAVLGVRAEARALAAGTPLTLGIRPEHLGTAAEGVPGQVRLAEHLGDRTFLHVSLPGNPGHLTLGTDPATGLGAGDPVQLQFPSDRCYLFDPAGQTLARPD